MSPSDSEAPSRSSDFRSMSTKTSSAVSRTSGCLWYRAGIAAAAAPRTLRAMSRRARRSQRIDSVSPTRPSASAAYSRMVGSLALSVFSPAGPSWPIILPRISRAFSSASPIRPIERTAVPASRIPVLLDRSAAFATAARCWVLSLLPTRPSASAEAMATRMWRWGRPRRSRISRPPPERDERSRNPIARAAPAPSSAEEALNTRSPNFRVIVRSPERLMSFAIVSATNIRTAGSGFFARGTLPARYFISWGRLPGPIWIASSRWRFLTR